MPFLRTITAVVILTGGLYWWQAAKPQVVQTARPVTLNEAQGKCPITLPSEAKNISYALRADSTNYEAFVRFDIPFEQAVIYVEQVFREHAQIMNTPIEIPEARRIAKKQQLNFIPDEELHVPWFDIGNIKNGVVYGKPSSWRPQVWLDKDRNLFFYCITD